MNMESAEVGVVRVRMIRVRMMEPSTLTSQRSIQAYFLRAGSRI